MRAVTDAVGHGENIARLGEGPVGLLIMIAVIGVGVAILVEIGKGFYTHILKRDLKKSPRATWAFGVASVALGCLLGSLYEGGRFGWMAGVIGGGTSSWWYHAFVRYIRDIVDKMVKGGKTTSTVPPIDDERDQEDL